MTARHPAPFVFATWAALAPTALAPGVHALTTAALAPRDASSPLFAALVAPARAAVPPEPAVPALPPGAARIVELAARGAGERPSPEIAAVLAELAPFLELLPLARLVAVELTSTRLELVFDVPRDETIAVELPARTLHVLACDDEDERDPLRRGRALRTKTEDQTLLVHGRVRFELGDEGIASVREGDLEVEAGPFAFDLAVRTERRPGRVARDRHGRPVLALDASGAPFKRDGRWVTATYDFWIVLEAFGRRVEVGVPSGPGPAQPRS
jgi:hypothetical protein